MGEPGPGAEVSKVTPQHRAVRDTLLKDKPWRPLRELGFTVGVIAPREGIFRAPARW